MARNKRRNKTKPKPGDLVRSPSTPVQPPRPSPAIQQQLLHVEEKYEEYTGPIPPPAMLRDYEQILPGLADRIITMAENQATHRRDIEKVVVYGGSRRSNLGLAAGLIVALAFGWWSYQLVLHDHELVGTIFGTADLGGLVSLFVIGRNKQAEERKQKQQLRR